MKRARKPGLALFVCLSIQIPDFRQPPGNGLAEFEPGKARCQTGVDFSFPYFLNGIMEANRQIMATYHTESLPLSRNSCLFLVVLLKGLYAIDLDLRILV